MDDVVIVGTRCTGSTLTDVLARDGLSVEQAAIPGETTPCDRLICVALPPDHSLALVGIDNLRASAARSAVIARPEKSLGRRLVAIFAADAAEYSRLMGQNEVETLRVLMAHRAVMEAMIAQHGGRIANTAGDSVLAEFPSVVDAVQCATAVQEQLAQANETLPHDRRLEFRIGIHVGEVLMLGGDLFGNGVNMTVRLQALAEAGGLCLSAEAHEHVRNLLPLTFEDLGPQQIKNVDEPVRVYSYKARSSGPTSQRDAPQLPPPDKLAARQNFQCT